MDEAHLPMFFDGQYIHEMFKQYSIPNIKSMCQKYLSTSRARTRPEVYEIIAGAPERTQEDIRQQVLHTAGTLDGERLYARKPTQDATMEGSVPCIERHTDLLGTTNTSSLSSSTLEVTLDHNAFMKAGSTEAVDSAIVEFIERTSNLAMARGVCAVCAREMAVGELTPHRLDAFPSPHRLQPTESHPAHDIFNEMLLHPAGIDNAENANICVECGRALLADKIPPFALANGLWIGDPPHELSYLTLPERLLIAKYFPAAYIIKLYPKKKGARHWDKRQLYSGMKGNVSTYQLDQSQITSMIDGTLMPQPSDILAATIGITFVGPKNLPDRGLPDLFKVRRARVQQALEWLVRNNPLYSNIMISPSRLAQLPEDDVPYELQATTKLSTDIKQLYGEQDGYVPEQDVGEDDGEEGKIKSNI